MFSKNMIDTVLYWLIDSEDERYYIVDLWERNTHTTETKIEICSLVLNAMIEIVVMEYNTLHIIYCIVVWCCSNRRRREDSIAQVIRSIAILPPWSPSSNVFHRYDNLCMSMSMSNSQLQLDAEESQVLRCSMSTTKPEIEIGKKHEIISSTGKKTTVPNVRIELTAFRFLVYFLDYETNALPTELTGPELRCRCTKN